MITIPFSRILVTALLVGLTAPSIAAPPQRTAAVDATKVGSWVGTWKCVSNLERYTAVIVPILNGSAIRIDDHSTTSDEILGRYDPKYQRWFYAGVAADGSYFTLLGPVSSNSISFRQVAPKGDTTLDLRLVSTREYDDTFAMTQGGKRIVETEKCIKK